MDTSPIILQLGSNLGNRGSNLARARGKISKRCSIKKVSSIFETEAWGNQDQSNFHNQLIEIETKLNPFALLRLCLESESQLGRKRERKWEPRIIDIDIILYRNMIIFSPELEIPHSLFRERRFVLEPLAESWGTAVDPISNLDSSQLLDQCADNSKVLRI